MGEMSMVQTLQRWNEAVSLTERGNFEDALIKFMSLEEGIACGGHVIITSARNLFNIGQTYFSLGRTDMAIKVFKQSITKDKMLAVAHFMLGCANLKSDLNREAETNFDNANFFLRGNRLIDYKQLGLKYKLHGCEILCNRGIAYARQRKDQKAKNDFLKAMEFQSQPYHAVIEDTLLCWQTGKPMEPLALPSHAVFQPSKSKMQAVKEKKVDYLGTSQVVAVRTDENQNQQNTAPNGIKHLPQAVGLVNKRNNLLTDLRKKETRKSLKKTSKPASALAMLPAFLLFPSTDDSTSSSLAISDQPLDKSPLRPVSPLPPRKVSDVSAISDLGLPPVKPLPPPPNSPRLPKSPRSTRSKSSVHPNNRPLPPHPVRAESLTPTEAPQRPPKRQGRTVTFQLIINRTVQVPHDSTSMQLSQVASENLGLPENAFFLMYKDGDNLSSVNEETLPNIWNTGTDNKTTIYCYEKKGNLNI